MATPAEFHRFSRLPAELRIQIWSLSFPDSDIQSVCFFQTGCWSAHSRRPGEWGYDPADPYNWRLDFRYDLLDKVRVKVSQYDVNYEARNATLAWACTQGFKIRSFDGQDVILRVANPTCDVMFVGSGTEDEFLSERVVRLNEPDLLYHQLDIPSTGLEYIAISEAFVWSTFSILYDILQLHTATKTVYIISGEVLAYGTEDTERHRWVVELSDQWTYGWDTLIGCFYWKEEKPPSDPDLRKTIEDAGAMVTNNMTSVGETLQKFKVQRAAIVKA